MSFLRRHLKLIAVAASCTAIGAGASVIASAGATSTSTSAQGALPAHPRLAVRHAIRGMVHAQAVVPTSSGFVTVTLDRGLAQSVSGQQLTLKEGTKTATYKTVTLSIPSDAIVRDNRQAAQLSDIKAGQHVAVLQGPNGTIVVARDVR